MAFIEKSSIISNGTVVVLKRDHSSMTGTFKAGTKVTITGYGDHGYDIVDDEGNHMYECGYDL